MSGAWFGFGQCHGKSPEEVGAVFCAQREADEFMLGEGWLTMIGGTTSRSANPPTGSPDQRRGR